MILTGKQPEDKKNPVESVKLETGTRLGTVKLTVDENVTDNIPVKGLVKKRAFTSLKEDCEDLEQKQKEYLKPSEVDIVGEGSNGEVVFEEAVSPDTINGTLTLKMKEGTRYERIIDLPFTGLKHLAFADKLTSYPDEMDASFYDDMCDDLNQDLEFVSTTRDSTISGGSLTIASSGGQGGDLVCEDITASGDVTGAGFVIPNGTASQFLKADGSVDTNIYVTTNTAQEITGKKTFKGSQVLDFKQGSNTDKPSFTIYNPSSKEIGCFQYRPDSVNGAALMYLGHYNANPTTVNQTYAGFRSYTAANASQGFSTAAAYNLVSPLPRDAQSPFSLTGTYQTFYLPLGFTDGTTVVKTASTGMTDLSSIIPSALSQLSDDSTHRLVTDSDISNWNSKTSNVGTITGVSVNGTSVATSGVADITSVPASILSGAIANGVTATTQPSGDNSTKVATTAYVDTAIDNLPEPMVFMGSLGTGGTITSLPTASSTNKGYTYKVITAGTYASQAAKVGDTFISDGSAWVLIPSGDEPSGTVTSVTIKATSPISIDSSSAITTSGTRTLSHANSGVTAGTYKSVTVNATGHVTAGTNPTTLSGYGITDAYTKTEADGLFSGVFVGTCTTAAATQAKVGTVDNTFQLTKGVIVSLKFTYTNTFSVTAENLITLNVNNTGAKNIYYANTTATTGTNATCYGSANYYITYMYDGTNWVWLNRSIDTNTTYSVMTDANMKAGTETTGRLVSAKLLTDNVKKRLFANSKTTAYPDGMGTAGWYRILDVTAYPKTFLITFGGTFNNARPTVATFLVSITYNDVRINQIGSISNVGWVQELRAVTHDTYKHYIDFRYKAEGATTTTKQNEIWYEVTPLDYHGTSYITQVDFTLITGTVTAEASCVTSTNVRADQLTTARTIWGQSFDGTGNVTGDLTTSSDIFITGANNLTFGFKHSQNNTNIDIGWDWANRSGSGAFFRSINGTDRQGGFGFYARNATQSVDFVGLPDGTLTWGNNAILTAGNYTSYTYSSTASRTANTVLAAPNGSAGAATFRALVAADIPDLSSSYLRRSDITGSSSTNVDANSLTQANTLYRATNDMGGTSATGTWNNFPTARPAGGFSLMNIYEGIYNRQIFGTYGSNKLYVRSQYAYNNVKTWRDWSELLDSTGGTISSTSFAPLVIERKNATTTAGIAFKNSNGILGYIGMAGAANTGLLRWNAAASTSYVVLDTGNYTSTLDTRYVKQSDVGNISGLFTGSCTSAADAQAKVATVGSNFSLVDGVTVAIKFTNTNTFSATAANVITLNVNNTGAKQIWYAASKANTGTNTAVYGYASRYITYMYDATNDVWVWVNMGWENDTNTLIRVYRQTTGYNADYPILVSRTATIGTAGTNNSNSAVYGVVFDSNQPTVNPNSGKMKVKALAVNGVDITGNSDKRLKDIQGNVHLSIEDIANAPSILYKRKDSDDEKVHLGSIAQYWEKIAPWAVGEDNDGMLTLDYPALSLAASIQCAREIVDLKKRIEKLEEKL